MLVRRIFGISSDKSAMGNVWNFVRHWATLGVVSSTLLVMTPLHAATETGTAQAEILLERLTLAQISGLDFGTIIPSAAPGRVNIRRNTGVCVARGGITLIGTNCQRGEFLVTGSANQQIRITNTPASITLTRVGGGAVMLMDRVRINGSRNKRLTGAGTRTFYVSGRLQVGANQTAGVYDGTFDVTVDYR